MATIEEPMAIPASTSLPAVVLIIDDDREARLSLRHFLEQSSFEVITASTSEVGLKLAAVRHPDVVLLDTTLPDRSGLDTFAELHHRDPRLPVIFITAGQQSETVIQAMQLGAYEYLSKPLDFGQVQTLVRRAVEIRRSDRSQVKLGEPVEEDQFHDCLVGRSVAMQEVYKSIGRVASQDVTVLIHGESGTGKELVAHAIYHHSARSKGPFLAVNCAAIPESLLESELFGHEKGSFTGADTRRIGKFEKCSGGTLFLDEIGDMTPLVQSKVLRLLQDQSFERVGGNETIHTDVRIIVATNRDLDRMVTKGEFRADLYYRLNGFVIKVPPLRRRADDLLALLQYFLRRFNRELGKQIHGISPDALELLLHYRWPGNVRELQSILKRSLLQSTGEVLTADFLPEEVRHPPTDCAGAEAYGSGIATPAGSDFIDDRIRARSEHLYNEAVSKLEHLLVTRVLEHTRGNQSHAARILGITRGSLRKKVQLCGIAIDPIVSADSAH